MKHFTLALVAAATFAVGCGGDSSNNDIVNPVNPTNQFTQVEILARPAVAEGLLFTNSNLAAYNSVSPGVAAGLGAANPVIAEATTVLGLLNAFGNPLPSPPFPAGFNAAAKAGAFLPDVMRIDTTVTVTANGEDPAPPLGLPVGNSLFGSHIAYSRQLNALGSPSSGRKLTDDTVDITLAVLTNLAVATDNVPYYRPPGNTNASIGHGFLNGQVAPFGPATFPYLARTY